MRVTVSNPHGYKMEHLPKRTTAMPFDAQKRGICAQIGGFCAIYLAVCAKKRTFAADF